MFSIAKAITVFHCSLHQINLHLQQHNIIQQHKLYYLWKWTNFHIIDNIILFKMWKLQRQFSCQQDIETSTCNELKETCFLTPRKKVDGILFICSSRTVKKNRRNTKSEITHTLDKNFNIQGGVSTHDWQRKSGSRRKWSSWDFLYQDTMGKMRGRKIKQNITLAAYVDLAKKCHQIWLTE